MDLNSFPFAGAWDPVASLIFTGPHYVKNLIVEGNLLIEDSRFVRSTCKKL